MRPLTWTGEAWLAVAIQALHPFYTRSQRVVASWMTRQNREAAIADNISYIDRVINQVAKARAAMDREPRDRLHHRLPRPGDVEGPLAGHLWSQQLAHDVYRQLVETNTVDSVGSTTTAFAPRFPRSTSYRCIEPP